MKITFLFGAGAEIEYGLPSGPDFAKSVLMLEHKEKNTAIDTLFTNQLNMIKKDSIYSEYIPTYTKNHLFDDRSIEKILLESYNKFFYNSPRKEEINYGYIFKCLVETLTNKNSSVDDFFIKIQSDNNVFTTTKNNKIIFNKSNINHERAFIETVSRYPAYMRFADEKFHTIINPNKFGRDNFWKILKLYESAWLAVTKIGECKESYTQSENINTNYIKYHKTLLNNFYELIKKEYNKNTYYKKILHLKKKHELCVITSNYTSIAENVLELNENKIAYLHGKLNWFEDPYTWEINDINELSDEKENLIFPYIFVQSGIKPIINEKQIEEYSKMVSMIINSDALIILGYGINYDDNHINSTIRKYIISNKPCIYFNYNINSNDNYYCIIEEKLRIRNLLKYNFKIITINERNPFEIELIESYLNKF